jgi:Domain of unknown function (DUF4326)
MAKRIQRRRTKGWKMPEGAVCVTRPSRWSNPWRISPRQSREYVLTAFRAYANTHASEIRMDLRGKDLVCWCPLVDKDGNRVPCHADVLLEIANSKKAGA